MFDALATQSRAGGAPPRPSGPAVDASMLRDAIVAKLSNHIGKRPAFATERDWLLATALAVRDLAVDRWLASIDAAYQQGEKRVYYLSLEFLIGRLLFDNLNNLGATQVARDALAELGVN